MGSPALPVVEAALVSAAPSSSPPHDPTNSNAHQDQHHRSAHDRPSLRPSDATLAFQRHARIGARASTQRDRPDLAAVPRAHRTFLNVVELTVLAALEARRDLVYQAALLDPNTAATLPSSEIVELCDELIAAHGDVMPEGIRA